MVAQDEERLKKAVNQVPSNEDLNVMIARSEQELRLFNQLDRELDWPDEQGTHLSLSLAFLLVLALCRWQHILFA